MNNTRYLKTFLNKLSLKKQDPEDSPSPQSQFSLIEDSTSISSDNDSLESFWGCYFEEEEAEEDLYRKELNEISGYYMVMSYKYGDGNYKCACQGIKESLRRFQEFPLNKKLSGPILTEYNEELTHFQNFNNKINELVWQEFNSLDLVNEKMITDCYDCFKLLGYNDDDFIKLVIKRCDELINNSMNKIFLQLDDIETYFIENFMVLVKYSQLICQIFSQTLSPHHLLQTYLTTLFTSKIKILNNKSVELKKPIFQLKDFLCLMNTQVEIFKIDYNIDLRFLKFQTLYFQDINNKKKL